MADMVAIRAAARGWTNPSCDVYGFEECDLAGCESALRFLDIRPGRVSSFAGDVLRLRPDTSRARAVHALGHVLGLPHTFERYDRDRHVPYKDDSLCVNGPPPRCRELSSADPAEPPIPTGMFGPYDPESVMNQAPDEVVCAPVRPTSGVDSPTAADVGAVIELYRTSPTNSLNTTWAPFQPLGKARSAFAPLDYELAQGIRLQGSPAVAVPEASALDVVARGMNDTLYRLGKVVVDGVFQRYSEWEPLGCCFASDPAVTSWGPDRLDVAAVSSTGEIWIRRRIRDAWSDWGSLGVPPFEIDSAPALATWGPGRLDVFVRGSDLQLYTRTCAGSQTETCAADSLAWSPWSPVAGNLFWGKPAAVANGVGRITVAVHAPHENTVHRAHFEGGVWQWARPGGGTLAGGSRETASSPAIAFSAGSDGPRVFIRGEDNGLWASRDSLGNYDPLGGRISGDPSASSARGSERIEVAAPIWNGATYGVWRKYSEYERPCYINQGCGECACGNPGEPTCAAR